MTTLAERAQRLKPRLQIARLPVLFLLSDDIRLPDPAPAIRALPRGSAVIFRHRNTADRKRRAKALLALCRACGVRLLIANDWRLAILVGADGLHLAESTLRSAPRTWRRHRKPGWLVTAAAHSPAAIQRAARAGVDAVLLAPVFATESHPGAPVLGPLRFTRWTRMCPVPVVALGGVTARGARGLVASGAAGFAAIEALMPLRQDSGESSSA